VEIARLGYLASRLREAAKRNASNWAWNCPNTTPAAPSTILDVIKAADWVIDLGPEGGEGGGQIIAAGTPEQVAKNKSSHTGKYLEPVLKRG